MSNLLCTVILFEKKSEVDCINLSWSREGLNCDEYKSEVDGCLVSYGGFILSMFAINNGKRKLIWMKYILLTVISKLIIHTMKIKNVIVVRTLAPLLIWCLSSGMCIEWSNQLTFRVILLFIEEFCLNVNTYFPFLKFNNRAFEACFFLSPAPKDWKLNVWFSWCRLWLITQMYWLAFFARKASLCRC